MQTKRVKFSIQRTSTTHNNSIKSRLFHELTSQLLNVILIEDQGIVRHILIIHVSIILSNMVVYVLPSIFGGELNQTKSSLSAASFIYPIWVYWINFSKRICKKNN